MSDDRRVLIVDDEAVIRDLLTRALVGRGFTCSAAEDGLSALAHLEAQEHAVVVSDVRMPELDGIELLKRIKARWPLTEVILVTGVFELRSGIEAMRNGAYDYLTKPFTIEDVVFAIDRAFQKRELEIQNRYYQENLEAEVELRTLELLESNQRIQQLFISMLRTLANSLETKDPYTHGHSERVAAQAVRLATRLQLPEADVSHIELAGLLHDIGKIGVREQVLHKPSKLTPDEYEHIKTHCELGERILQPVEEFSRILDYVRHHHERFDGQGYPDGIPGDGLSLGAKILAVCDAYDAMTSVRPYRASFSRACAMEEIRRCRGSQFDPLVADALLETLAQEPAPATTSAAELV